MHKEGPSQGSVVYIARVTHEASVGIRNKIRDTVAAIREAGYSGRVELFHEHWQRGIFKVAHSIIASSEDLIILRSDHHSMIFNFLPMLYARLRKQRIIIDVANPVGVAKNEIAMGTSRRVVKWLKTLLLYVTYPLVFFPANRLLEYGDEDPRFIRGVEGKVRLVGNGIRVNDVKPRGSGPKFDERRFIFVSAGHIAFWHGYDRLVRSIAEYNERRKGEYGWIEFQFRIIGSGFEMEYLLALVRDLGLSEQIKFLGVLEGDNLAAAFEDCHVGICNLGQHRKGLYRNSELKTRDFCARGVPFVLACEDTDFDAGSLPFVFNIPNDESLVPLEAVASWYRGLCEDRYDFSDIRNFAKEKLDFAVKVDKDYLSVLRD